MTFEERINLYKERFPELRRRLEADPENVALHSEAETLANETGFTVWFESRIIEDTYDPMIIWKVFIPNNVSEREMEILWSLRDIEIRCFLWGESEGHKRDQWVQSFSC